MAEKAVPHNDIVYKLRESMLNTTEGENSPALERMLEEEIKARPGDVGLRVRLVTLLQRSGRIKEGFTLCSELEQKRLWFTSREWYSCLVELCENYQVSLVSVLKLLTVMMLLLRSSSRQRPTPSSTVSTWLDWTDSSTSRAGRAPGWLSWLISSTGWTWP